MTSDASHEDGANTTRLQFDFEDGALARLTTIKEKLGAETNAEVVRRSLRLFEWLMGRVERGEGLDDCPADVLRMLVMEEHPGE